MHREEGAVPGLRRVFLAPVEWVFTRLSGSHPMAGSRGTFLVAFRRYSGPTWTLPDGATVRRGDRLCEIHFWNRRISAREGRSAGRVTWRFIRDFRADLGTLARLARRGELPGVRAVYGVSPLAPAAARFGFHVRPLPRGLRRALITAWQRGLRQAFRPRAVRTDMAAPSAELWMSVEELKARYADDDAAANAADTDPGHSPGVGRTRNA